MASRGIERNAGCKLGFGVPEVAHAPIARATGAVSRAGPKAAVVNVAPIKQISIGKDVDMSVSSSVMAAVNDAGSGLLHNLAGRCLMSSITDRATKTFEQHGYCSYIDADGDQIFEKVDFDRQALAPVIVAKGQWIIGAWPRTAMETLAGADDFSDIAEHDGVRPLVGCRLATAASHAARARAAARARRRSWA